MFQSLTASQGMSQEPIEEIAAAKAAGKCGDCFACCAGYHEQCKGPDFDWNKELEVDQACADAEIMNHNMRLYGCIDVPKI